jgi:[ribosomal protein S5]-alanine N-acetyltransferase
MTGDNARCGTMGVVSDLEIPWVIAGNGIRLRPWRDDDLSALRAVAEDPYAQLLTGLTPGDEEGARAYLEAMVKDIRRVRGLGYSFAIADDDTGEAVGSIGMWLRAVAPDGATGYREEAHGRGSLGYWSVPARRRSGVATEALRIISPWALSLGSVERLELFIETSNVGSWRAAERAGYQREGLLRSFQRIGGERRDMFVYSRLPTDAV